MCRELGRIENGVNEGAVRCRYNYVINKRKQPNRRKNILIELRGENNG